MTGTQPTKRRARLARWRRGNARGAFHPRHEAVIFLTPLSDRQGLNPGGKRTMRKRAVTLLLAVVTAGLLVTAVGTAGASVDAKKAKAPLCAGKTKKAAIAGVKKAYNTFIDGSAYSLAGTQAKEPYIQFLSGANVNAALKAQFEKSSLDLASAATGTTLQINSVKCTGKKTADVSFDYIIGGKPLTGVAPPGTAILAGKVWQVSGITLCNTEAGSDPTVVDHDPCLTIINS